MDQETCGVAVGGAAANGVVVLSGPPCSGKSSVARILAGGPLGPFSRSVHLEVDALFSLLLPGSTRGREDRMLAYGAAHTIARLLVQHDRTVVLECTYARHEQRRSLVRAFADSPSTPFWVVEFFVRPDDAVQRFRHRDQASDLDEGSVLERAEAFPYLTGADALRLESGESRPDELARQVADWLCADPPPVSREAWTSAGRAWD